MRKTSLTLLVAVMAMAIGATAMVWGDDSPPAPANPPATAPASDVGSDANPVMIPQLPDAITIDGDPAKWDKIKAVPAPFAKKDAGSLKLAWRDDGLYGLVQVKDDSVKADDTNPWTADCLELWLETDDAKADDMSDNADQIALPPNPTAGAGKTTPIVIGNINADAIKSMWKPTADGYAIEFFIPVKELTPAKMEAGTKIGMNYSVDEKGKSIEEFFADKDTDDGYKTPKSWGTFQLAK